MKLQNLSVLIMSVCAQDDFLFLGKPQKAMFIGCTDDAECKSEFRDQTMICNDQGRCVTEKPNAECISDRTCWNDLGLSRKYYCSHEHECVKEKVRCKDDIDCIMHF